ncbi:hypothetical protein [Streptomyces geranii]|uniref:hypothetical protein n=1 Tax=Streptomyces geranii TaxID=2058923 RepID=UPI000D0364F6|nr:hypothetical protein [Streptomyces geranii]
MQRQYHLPDTAAGAHALSDSMSRQTGRQLVATVLASVVRGVRTAAPDQAGMPTDPARRPTGEPFAGPGAGGRYAVPSYDDDGNPVHVELRPQVPGDPGQGAGAFPVDDGLLGNPDVEEIRNSPQMHRYFALRATYRRLHPNRRLPDFAPLRLHQLPALTRAYGQLQQLSELDWTLLEQQSDPDAPPPGDWERAGERLDSFLNSPERARAVRDAAARDAAIDAAHARVDPGREARAIGRLTGLEKVYESVKFYEGLPNDRPSREGFDTTRKQDAKDAMLRALNRADFATLDAFDTAVRALREVVRERAVNIALATMKQSERVLRAELHRYREPGALVTLAGELAALRRPPAPTEDAVLKLLGDYPILRDPVALRGALAVEVPELLGDLLRQNAQAQLGNIDGVRATLGEDRTEVFGLDHVIDETLEQLGLPANSVQARLIRDRRGAPGHPVRAAVDLLLLFLSFAGGPLAAVGHAARAVILALQIHDVVKLEGQERRQRAQSHAGTPLATTPLPRGHGWELFALFASLGGAVPGAPRTLLPGGARLPQAMRLSHELRLSARADELLATGAVRQGRPWGFLPGTRFAEAGPGQVAIWHPDFPDEVFRLDTTGLTRFSKANGIVEQTGHWPLGSVDAAAAAAPATRGAVVRPGTRALPAPPVPVTPPSSAVRPGLGSLGAMSRLAPATHAAEVRLRAVVQRLAERTEKAADGFRGFADGERKRVLLGRAEALAGRLRSYDQRLTVGLSGYRKGWTEPAMDEEVRQAIGWVERRLHSATNQVRRLELQVPPVPFPTAARQAVIDQYVRELAALRDLQTRVVRGETSALALRDEVRDRLIGLERRAARHAPGEETLLFDLESLARERRRLLTKDGLHATVAGRRTGLPTAATVLPGALANRSYAEIAAGIGRPPKIELRQGARQPHAPRTDVGGAVTLTWAFKDGSVIRIDVPGPGRRPFASGSEPHVARIGPDHVHYDDQGIAVPTGSTPAHIPLRVAGRSDPLYGAIEAARNAATGSR